MWTTACALGRWASERLLHLLARTGLQWNFAAQSCTSAHAGQRTKRPPQPAGGQARDKERKHNKVAGKGRPSFSRGFQGSGAAPTGPCSYSKALPCRRQRIPLQVVVACCRQVQIWVGMLSCAVPLHTSSFQATASLPTSPYFPKVPKHGRAKTKKDIFRDS